MIRSICITALCGVLFLTALPVQAEELPPPAPVSPSSVRQTSLPASRLAAPRQAAPGDVVTATAQSSLPGAAVPSVNAALTNSLALTSAESVTATATVTASQMLTAAQSLTASLGVTDSVAPTLTLPTPTAAVAITNAAGAGDIVAGTDVLTETTTLDPALDSQYAGVLEGTIIANRTEADVRFFVEGQVYDLAPLRALGLPLPRSTAVLNLFNCDARQSENDAGCFWDPYLLKQDGFYEVVTGEEAGALVSLSLREAGAPPANQIWVQNRTGARESIIVNGEVIEIAPASVQQFSVEGEGPVMVHLRNCITQGAQTACEWAPQGVDAGYYYALIKLATVGANNTTVTTARLEGVVASGGEVVERPAQASCLLRVPTLNVRGGPGLEFPVIAKVRGSEEQPGSVVVVGFDASKQWMQVSDRIAAAGWVTSNPDFIVCTGDLAALPVDGVLPADAAADAAAAETPATEATAEPVAEATAETVEDIAAVGEEPVVEAPVIEEAPVETAPIEATDEGAAEEITAEATTAAPETTPAPAGIPTGQARLVVNNGFDQVMRFTLDQKFRVEMDNLSGEWDLQPGQSISILVYPGMIPFSVSTPWRGLSDNADVTVEADQERALWLYFIHDPDGSGNWILQF